MIEVPSQTSCCTTAIRASLLFKQQIVLDGKGTPESKGASMWIS